MGAVFYHQIYNTYLTDDRIGEGVDNETIVDGKELYRHGAPLGRSLWVYRCPTGFCISLVRRIVSKSFAFGPTTPMSSTM